MIINGIAAPSIMWLLLGHKSALFENIPHRLGLWIAALALSIQFMESAYYVFLGDRLRDFLPYSWVLKDIAFFVLLASSVSHRNKARDI